jgi:hypothetical protein
MFAGFIFAFSVQVFWRSAMFVCSDMQACFSYGYCVRRNNNQGEYYNKQRSTIDLIGFKFI